LPQVMKDSAALEGAYRFFNNPRVDSEAVVAPHVRCSCERATRASAAGLWVLARGGGYPGARERAYPGRACRGLWPRVARARHSSQNVVLTASQDRQHWGRRKTPLSGGRGRCRPRRPQIRTCPTKASGSSDHRFASRSCHWPGGSRASGNGFRFSSILKASHVNRARCERRPSHFRHRRMTSRRKAEMAYEFPRMP